jgi:hypothetical protein
MRSALLSDAISAICSSFAVLFHYTKYEFGKGSNIAIDTCFFEGFHVLYMANSDKKTNNTYYPISLRIKVAFSGQR